MSGILEAFAKNLAIAAGLTSGALIVGGIGIWLVNAGIRAQEEGRGTKAASLVVAAVVVGAAIIMTTGGATR